MKKLIMLIPFLISFSVQADYWQKTNYQGIHVEPVNTTACKAAFVKNLTDGQTGLYPYTIVSKSAFTIDGKLYQSAIIKGKLTWPRNNEDKARYVDYWLSINKQNIPVDNVQNLNFSIGNYVIKPTITLTAQQYNIYLKAKIRREIDNSVPCVKFRAYAGDGILDMDPVSESFDINMGMVYLEPLYPVPDGIRIAIIDSQKTDATYEPHNIKMLTPISVIPNEPPVRIDIFKTHMDLIYHIVAQNSDGAKILPIYGIKVNTDRTITSDMNIAKAIDFAILSNVRVIVNAWHLNNGNSLIISEKFAQATRQNIMIVQSAGNSGSILYNRPADSNIMVVGMLKEDGTIQSDVGAFGPDIVIKSNFDSTYVISHQNTYGTAPASAMGSSGATAFVSALVARFPKNKTVAEIKKCIYDTADKIPSTIPRSKYVKYGILNPAAALKACEIPSTPPITYRWVIAGADGVGWQNTYAKGYIAAREAKCRSLPNSYIAAKPAGNIEINCYSSISNNNIESIIFARVPSDTTQPILYQNAQPEGVEIGRISPGYFWD